MGMLRLVNLEIKIFDRQGLPEEPAKGEKNRVDRLELAENCHNGYS